MKPHRQPLAVIWASAPLRFLFALAVLQTAGLTLVVPSLSLQLDAMEAAPGLLGWVAATAPLVSMLSPALAGLIVERLKTRTPYTAVFGAGLLFFIVGNLAHASAETPFRLVVGRFCIGLSMGAVGIGGAFIIQVTTQRLHRSSDPTIAPLKTLPHPTLIGSARG